MHRGHLLKTITAKEQNKTLAVNSKIKTSCAINKLAPQRYGKESSTESEAAQCEHNANITITFRSTSLSTQVICKKKNQ